MRPTYLTEDYGRGEGNLLYSKSTDLKVHLALAGVAQLAGHVPGQGTCLGAGPGPGQGACERRPINVSLSHQSFSPSLPPSLNSLFLPLSV